MDKVVFATNNQGKVEEVTKLAKSIGTEVISLSAAGVDSNPAETGKTFEENAHLKLRDALPKLSEIKVWVAAEDSGILIDALGGDPGVKTRRWAGHEMSDEEIVDYTIQKLEGVPYAERNATFKSVVALAHSTNPEAVKYFEGEIAGTILLKPDQRQPLNGLPFRQLFYISEVGRMLGDTDDLPPEQAGFFLTHRQRSFKKVFSYINDLASLNG